VNGAALKTYSVVVGSFINQVNAEALLNRLKAEGNDARIIKTNETINGQTGWYRVIASSYSDKAAAATSRDQLRSKYAGAWLLYTK
ncbi:MAG: SPOR domain-containing protein, partial [Bacteroidales bacterium]|nr:SPOR domain-containing protein [Bacteroidales bacterium]